MFIVFNTVNQVNNYLKRHPGYHHTEGCGCCYNIDQYHFDGKNVVNFTLSSYAGGITTSTNVIGRLRKR